MKILDATCGTRGIWYQKNHPFVTYMDIRKGTFFDITRKPKNRRIKVIDPDVQSSWDDAPFPCEYFDMIIFDPPHILEKKKNSFLTVEYGMLNKDTWKNDLKTGINKLFSILKPEGIFIFKWCEFDVKINEVLRLFPYEPLFGNVKDGTYWIVFLKFNANNHMVEG